MKKVKYVEEEGTFYERVFSPSRIKVLGLEKKEKRTWAEARRGSLKLEITDERGATIEVEGTRLVSRVLGYLRPYTSFKNLSAMKGLKPSVLEKHLNKALKKRDRELKALFDEEGSLRGITSTMHRQVSWKRVRQIIESAVEDICGSVVKPEPYGHFGSSKQPFRWNYRLPLENPNVSAWVGVHAGNNIIKGRSGIHVWSRWRTEREGGGGVSRPACLNWCGMWEVPLQWFDIDVERLDNIYKVLGEDKVNALKLTQFHIKPDMKKFDEEVREQMASMVEAVEALQPIIDESIHSPLSKKEMEAILTAYQEKVHLPDYIIKQILAKVEEETVWGFSQAISWVRTHGKFKMFKICKPIEDRSLTRTLENIAGEVLSLTLTLNDLHKRFGQITLNLLRTPEKIAVKG